MEEEKIIVLVNNLYSRGVQRVQINLAIEFYSLGHNVEILVFNESGPLIKDIPKEINVTSLNIYKRAYTGFFRLVKYLRNNKISAVFSAEEHMNLLLLLSLPFVGRKFFTSVSCHVSLDTWYSKSTKKFSHKWFVSKLVSLMYPRAGQVVAINDKMLEEYKASFNLKSNIIKVYNPIVNNELKNRIKKSSFKEKTDKKEKTKLISIGSLSPIKGFDILIDAIDLVVNKGKGIELVIIGCGPLEEQLKNQVKELGLEGYVNLIGYIDNPIPYLMASDIFILSSRSEALPTVLIEAMACELGLIATDCSAGVREILLDGELGLICPKESASEMGNAILELIENPSIHNKNLDSLRRFESKYCAEQYLYNFIH